MVLGQGKMCKLTSTFYKTCSNYYSTSTAIKKSVFISQSKDVYENLALEKWLYQNMDFKNHHVLMLWQNNSCFILGRHQNPWLEIDCDKTNNVQIARRNSVGRTVYQDKGNLNFTFFASSNATRKMRNLEIIKRAVLRKYDLDMNINNNELFVKNLKIGETAKKFGFSNGYHHGNLKVESIDLNQSAQIKTWNLITENSEISIDGLLSAVGWEFLRTNPFTLKDGGKEEANKQKGFHMINPSETWFPGINSMKEELKSWEWCFGKTPNFKITRTLTMPPNFCDSGKEMKLNITVEQGIISDISFFIPPGLTNLGFTGEASVISNLKGQRFNKYLLRTLMESLGQNTEESGDKEKIVTKHMQRVMTSM